MTEISERLSLAMKGAKVAGAAELSRRLAMKESTVRAYVAGSRNPPLDVCEKIGRALGVQGRWLFDGTGPQARKLTRLVPLVGYVGAGAAAAFFADGQGPFDEIDAPPGANENTVAVEIRGESLGALFDQWLVFYDDVHDPPHPGMLKQLCVCGLADGRILIKKLVKGQLPGHFNLLSNTEPPIYDVIVEWAAIVTSMRPR